jgi:hypothetical protein
MSSATLFRRFTVMSATQHSSTKEHSPRLNFSLVAAVLTASTLALGGTALTAAPAEAATTRNGCTITPLKPKLLANHDVRYSVKIRCTPDTTVTVRSQPWEQDGGTNADDKLKHYEEIERHIPSANAVTVSYVRDEPNTENGNEEVYHAVQFKVRPPGDWAYGSWHSAGNSPILIIKQ